MSLSLIILIVAGVAGVFGVWKIAKAVFDNLKAKDMNKGTKKTIDEGKEQLKEARAKAQKYLQKFGEKKVNCYEESIVPFVRVMNQMKNIDLIETRGFPEGLQCSTQEFMKQLQVGISFAEAITSCDESGLFDGAMSAFGARGSAAVFAVEASEVVIGEGTGIPELKPMLAWLCGGALAAGGLGMVSGATALCVFGIVPTIAVIAPALAVMGLFMGKRASENFNHRAFSNLADGMEASNELETVASDCNDISCRVRSYISMMTRLNVLMLMGNVKLTQIVTNQGVDLSCYDNASKAEVAKIVSNARALKALLDIALVKKDGSSNEEAEKMLVDVKNFLKR